MAAVNVEVSPPKLTVRSVMCVFPFPCSQNDLAVHRVQPGASVGPEPFLNRLIKEMRRPTHVRSPVYESRHGGTYGALWNFARRVITVSYTHLRAHETDSYL